MKTLDVDDSLFMSVVNKALSFSYSGESSIVGVDFLVSVLNEEYRSARDVINSRLPLHFTPAATDYTTSQNGLTGHYPAHRADGFGENDIYKVPNDHLGVDIIVVITRQPPTSTLFPYTTLFR